MRTRSQGDVRRLVPRRLLAALAISVGVVVGTLAAPSPAAAHHEPAIIPPNGWCYYDWYVFGTNNGQVHQPYGSVKHLDNQSSQTVTWSEQLSVSFTFTSSYTYTQSFNGGVDLGIIKFGTDSATSTTSTWSISVNQTTSFSVQVPPHSIMYAQYGAYGLDTDGTYYQEQFECFTYEHDTVTSGHVDGFSLTSVGWRIWEG